MLKDFLENNKDIGTFVLRVTIGIAYTFIYGLMKIEAGPEIWTQIGSAMSNIGINFAPTFWGFMATLSEFGGGIFLMLGLFTRYAMVFMIFTMIMATITHLSFQDQWYNVMNPINMIAVFIAILFWGPGKYSLDALLFKKKSV
jgi:putative oxidoreductase